MEKISILPRRQSVAFWCVSFQTFPWFFLDGSCQQSVLLRNPVFF